MSFKSSLLITLALISGQLTQAAESTKNGFSRRSEARETKRWTLAEWLEQKQKVSLMDSWLAQNSPSPYEFMLELSQWEHDYSLQSTTEESKNHSKQVQGGLNAFAQFVGVGVEYSDHADLKRKNLLGLLHLRLLGASLQNSSLILSLGQQTITSQSPSSQQITKNPVAQIRAEIHITRFFGIDGLVRKATTAKNSETLNDESSDLSQVGLFIDFKALRIYGAWQTEKRRINNSTQNSTEEFQGVLSGIKIYY